MGDDVANLNDGGDGNANLGWLTQDTLTGLDMAPRTGARRAGPAAGPALHGDARCGAEFTIMLSQVQGGVARGIGAMTFAARRPRRRTSGSRCRSCCSRTTPGSDDGVSMSCGLEGDTRCAASVYVWLVGDTYVIGFRGEVNENPQLAVTIKLAALGTGATAVATDASSQEGIRYVGLETLNLALGSGSDVLNVQGTLPVTNVSFGNGDDRVYISSRAEVGLTEEPEFLAGDLDAIEGTLNLDLGSGRHTLLVSDEGAGAGDGTVAAPVLITDVASAAIARDADLATAGEIFVVGLAPAGISWRTNTAAQAGGVGTLADGVRIWTSGSADTIVIDGTHERAGVRTTTWLNTGLGSDVVTVALTAGQDGFFVLNTQGPNDNVLDLAANLDDGDEPVAADRVVSVKVNGTPIDPERYVVSSRLDTIGLFDSLVPGDVVTVTLHLVAGAVQSSGTFDLGTLAGLVGYRVWVNGRLLTAPEVTFTGTLLTFAAPAQRDGSPAHVVVEVTRTSAETFTMPAAGAILPAGTSDDDLVNGQGSTLPLVIFGGIGADELNGGTGGDIVFGDRGLVQWVNAAGQVVAQSGNGGVDDFTDGVVRPLGLVSTVDPTIGGDDVITTGVGADIVLGGAGGDQITTNRGETSSLSDASGIVFGDHGFIDWVSLDANTADLDRVWSTDPAFGGVDTITTGVSDDLVVGGTGGDTITVSDGRNVVLGDNGRFTATSAAVSTPAWGALPLTAGRLETSDPTVGGGDTITSGAGIDLVLGGAAGDTVAVGANDDVVVGDHGFLDLAVRTAALRVITVTVTDNGIGGNDTLRGQAGMDVLIGGTGSDRIDGGTEEDLIFGDNVSLDRFATFGDHTSPRYRVLSGTQIYSTDLTTAGNALVTATSQNNPAGATAWSDFRVAFLDHDLATQAAATPGVDGKPEPSSKFGDDYIAGGAHDDIIFGQLGNDMIQGDGSIDEAVGASRNAAGYLVLDPSVEATTDGDDYIEGGGGSDVVFGNLGRDDIIGGSSALFSLVTKAQRPDGADLLFGGAGTDVGRNDDTALHGRDSDAIVGDNGNILRIVTVTNATSGATAYRTFTYDTYTGTGEVRLIPRAVVLLDYTPGGPDVDANALTGDVVGNDEVHGESGDDTVYTGGGNDVVFGDAGDDDLIGGWGHDWISGGTGIDGILGDDGRIFTSRNGSTEPLNGVTHREHPAGDHHAGPGAGRDHQPDRAAEQAGGPHTVRGERRLRGHALRGAVRERRDLRRLGRRLHARRLRRRRDLRCRGARHLLRAHVRRRHRRAAGGHRRRRDRVEPAGQRRHAARLRHRDGHVRPLRRVQPDAEGPAECGRQPQRDWHGPRVVPQLRPHRGPARRRRRHHALRRRRRPVRRPRQRLARGRHRPRHPVGRLGQRPPERRRRAHHQRRSQRPAGDEHVLRGPRGGRRRTGRPDRQHRRRPAHRLGRRVQQLPGAVRAVRSRDREPPGAAGACSSSCTRSPARRARTSRSRSSPATCPSRETVSRTARSDSSPRRTTTGRTRPVARATRSPATCPVGSGTCCGRRRSTRVRPRRSSRTRVCSRSPAGR